MITASVVLLAVTSAPIMAGVVAKQRRTQNGSIIGSHLIGLPCALFAMAVVVFLSLRYGSLEVSWLTAWEAIFDYDSSDQKQVVVRELRVPRMFLGLAAGSSLAVAGALVQGVTRNPLAGPGILGINQGAAFAVVTAIFVADIVSPAGYVWFAFIGATVAAFLVYTVAHFGSGGPTPIKLVLSGVIVMALLGSWTSALLLLDLETLDEARFWLAGSISGRGTEELRFLFPFIIVALIVGVLMGKQVNVLNLGEDMAASMGQRTNQVRILAGLIVIILSGSAVAIAGPIAFIGLAVPHMVRSLVGPDYRWILLYCVILGPCLLLGSDIVGRLIVRPTELQVGIVTAAVGAPFLIYLVRFTKISEI